MYSGRSFRFFGSSFFPIFYCPLFLSSVGYILLVFDINNISWYYVLHSFGHLINCIIPEFQFTSGLCLTNQSYPKNMSMPFKSMTTVSMCSLCLLICSSSSANLVTSPFLVPSVLKTLNIYL